MDGRRRQPEPEKSPNEIKRPRIQTTESKVLHVRALPGYVTEQEVVDVVKEFGNVKKVLLLQDKNQAFVEMESASQAADVLAGLEYSYPTIRHKRVYWQYSDRAEVEAKTAVYVNDNRVTGETQGSLDPAAPIVVLLSISNVTAPVTLESVHQIGVQFGNILRIITFFKGADFQALLEFSTPDEAILAQAGLDGKDMYHGCCHIKASFSNKNTLDVKVNDQRSWDYTLACQQAMMYGMNPMQYYYGYPGFDGMTSAPVTVAPVVDAYGNPLPSAPAIPPVGIPAALAPAALAPPAAHLPSIPPPPIGLPPSIASPMTKLTTYFIDCFGSRPFQGTGTVVVYFDGQQRHLYDDKALLSHMGREFNTVVVFAQAVAPDRPDFNLCWITPGFNEGEDSHGVTTVLAVAHLLFLTSKATRTFTAIPRAGLHKQLTVRETTGVSRVIWITVPLSPQDAFTEEPWFRYETRDQSKHTRFLQGLKLDIDKVVTVERNGHGVVVVQLTEETVLLRFNTRLLPSVTERVSVLVLTVSLSKRLWQEESFDCATRVFVVDSTGTLQEDFGSAAAGVALSTYWFPKTNKANSTFRNQSPRPGVLCTRLQLSGTALNGSLPFDRVEIGGQAITTLTGEIAI